jgi:hypothetical protein
MTILMIAKLARQGMPISISPMKLLLAHSHLLIITWNHWVLVAATPHTAMNGRRAVACLLLFNHVGALSPGRKADFLILDCSGPEVRPSWDFTWELVRQYDRADILAAFVDGEPLCIGGKSTRFNSSRFLSEAEPHAIQSVIEARLVRLHPTSEAARSTR